MLGDYSVEMEEGTAAAVRELRETARELEVSRSDYAEMQRAVQLLQVHARAPSWKGMSKILLKSKIHSLSLQTSRQHPFGRHLLLQEVGNAVFS